VGSANYGNNRATCVTLWENVTHAACATLWKNVSQSDAQECNVRFQRHVIAFRPISVAARSWSYDNII